MSIEYGAVKSKIVLITYLQVKDIELFEAKQSTSGKQSYEQVMFVL